ncbi:SNARE associated Golgi protein [Methanococcus vannielii SB]|uniref:SNARE associated Golgi protein n=1 Tax=Methanococcus vannielii (strain ATCC 35089 / DSM 1224 / JCM 13029 / OCM 148 / SB) TaxID=406327 RepID=A6UPX6_METVS|nr:YqaA family protein [Methanococcus vannielii]ABR54548.1 SNARE associated Golgi protein [Methanococcus vannielii SB]
MDLTKLGIGLVEEYGYYALFLIGFFEPIFQPVPNEIFMIAGITLGMDWKLVLISATIGITLGSSVTYYLSSKYGEKLVLKLFGREKYLKSQEFLKKWGFFGIIIASFAPVPFELICWTSGIFKMPFKVYIFAVFFSRIIKYTLIVLPFAAIAKFWQF